MCACVYLNKRPLILSLSGDGVAPLEGVRERMVLGGEGVPERVIFDIEFEVKPPYGILDVLPSCVYMRTDIYQYVHIIYVCESVCVFVCVCVCERERERERERKRKR